MRSPATAGPLWRGRMVVSCLIALVAAAPASAIELFDGRVQIHGYAETQVRTLAADYDMADLDLSQWYLIGNVELELDLLPRGFGPIDLMGGYVRVEGRYDCLWSSACGLFQTVDTYGNHSERLPGRLSDAHKNVFRGTLSPRNVRVDSNGTTQDFSDRRRRMSIPLGQDGTVFAVGPLARPVPGHRRTGRLWHVPALGQLFFGLPGLDPDGVDGNLNPVVDPGLGDENVAGCVTGNTSALPCRYSGAYVAENYFDYRFGTGATRGNVERTGTTVFGPWRPKDHIDAWGTLADRVNPYDEDSVHPVLVTPNGGSISGFGDLPFRPEPRFAADTNGDGRIDQADDVGALESRGLYYPSEKLKGAIQDSRFSQPAVNFDQTDLSFNRGYAQEQTYELKEGYLDIEMLDHALWIRAGRQTIVWGKTELFRSQDQFNPQDLGLSSLPSLEESRIPLWALRAIYSFYDVGPLQDVRLEGALLIDDFQPLDFGRCGEPYAPPQACTLAAGLFAHGLTGVGIAGQFLPDAPWEHGDQFEGGLRVEWRWDRLSFALTEWVGYPDIPHVEILQEWERNVDPRSGRPRQAGATGPCDEGTEPSCFAGGIARDEGTVGGDFNPNLARPEVDDVLAFHHANQSLFATICASTIDPSGTQPGACAFNSWNTQDLVPTPIPGLELTYAQAFSAMLQGQGQVDSNSPLNGKVVYANLARWTTDGTLQTSPDPAAEEDRMPLVPLHVNNNPDPQFLPLFNVPIDGSDAGGFRKLAFNAPGDVCDPAAPDCSPPGLRPRGLSPTLTVEQEALLGCGDFWGTDCDIHGIDIFDAEASALTQSWPGFEGAGGTDWDPFDGSVVQPGTIGFQGGPVCTRWDRSARETLVLPGCRGVRGVQLMQGMGGMSDTVVALYDPGYDLAVDGCVFAPQVDGLDVVGVYPDGSPVDLSNCVAGPGRTIRTLYHPFAGCLSPVDEAAGLECILTDPLYLDRDFDAQYIAYLRDPNARPVQVFRSEMAALSWNMLMVLVATSTPPNKLDNTDCMNPSPVPPASTPGCSDRPPRFDEFDVNDPERLDGCSFRRPFLCKTAGPFFSITAARRNTVRAGGNTSYGRRDFAWHAGAIATLDYKRRNVLGFAMDFPEDVTKTNWGLEFTWFDRVMMANNDEFDGLSKTQHFNLSVAVDRPTFIRFLNASRTFLFNGQVFLQYIDGYKSAMPQNGPLNVLVTLFAATAYHQDRLIPNFTFVHDFSSQSGALISSLTYRYTTHFSVGVGAAAFYGRIQSVEAPLVGIAGASGGENRGAYHAYVENGLSSIRDRDELFLRFRYTF